jgi:uncharacterized membrane protein (DUF441 family)
MTEFVEEKAKARWGDFLPTLWPMAVVVVFMWLVSLIETPPPSTVTLHDWKAWAALLATFATSFLLKGGIVEKGHQTAIFFAGFVVARLLFW